MKDLDTDLLSPQLQAQALDVLGTWKLEGNLNAPKHNGNVAENMQTQNILHGLKYRTHMGKSTCYIFSLK